MAALKYYYDLMSQPCRAVYIFLRVNKIPYEDKVVALRKGEHKTEDFATQVNPFKLVPAIEDNGFRLTESIAIVEYLMNTRKVPEHWYPTSDPRQRAKVSEYLHWQHTNTRLHCAMLFQQKLIIPTSTGKPVNQDRVKRIRERINSLVIPGFENYFLRQQPSSRGPFIGGQEEISVADIFAACELSQVDGVWEEEVYSGSPIITGWLKVVRERVGAELFDEAHSTVQRARKAYKGLGLE